MRCRLELDAESWHRITRRSVVRSWLEYGIFRKLFTDARWKSLRVYAFLHPGGLEAV